MKKILKNPQRQHLKTIFRGRDQIFKSKAALTFDMDDEEQAALYHHWKAVYGFLYDVTSLFPNLNAEEVK